MSKKIARKLVRASVLTQNEKDDLVLYINDNENLADSISELQDEPDELTPEFLRKCIDRKKPAAKGSHLVGTVPELERINISRFWSAVCNNEVIVTGEPMVYSLETSTDARWGPFIYSPTVIVERAEYTRVWESIQSNPRRCLMMIRGTKGIGKSVFLYWLINKLVAQAISAQEISAQDPVALPSQQEASSTSSLSTASALNLAHNTAGLSIEAPPGLELAGRPVGKTATGPSSTSTSNSGIPCFLLLLGSLSSKRYYWLHHDIQGRPIVTECSGPVSTDYLLSDVAYDLSAAPSRFNLYVCSYGPTNTRPFHDEILNARQQGAEYVMGVCPLLELQLMFPGQSDNVDFSFCVFGGSARHVGSLVHGDPVVRMTSSFPLVQQAMMEFFDASDYSTSPLIDQCCKKIACEMDNTMWVGPTEGSLSLFNSLFRHTSVELAGHGDVMEVVGWASAFMRHLGFCIIEREQTSVLAELKKLLTTGGLSQLFEREVHKTIFEKFTKGGDLELTRLYKSGAVRAAGAQDVHRINIRVSRKVFVRTIEDLRDIKVHEYAMPSITNYALIDAMIKMPDYVIELNMTLGIKHAGAKAKHPDIETAIGGASADHMMVFCLDRTNFDNFRYVEGLVEDVPQYKMMAEWRSNLKRPAEET